MSILGKRGGEVRITFLIGNGFDLNLGMKTSYKDFYEHYCKPHSEIPPHVQEFKNNILNNYKTWADAELAFGKYSENFEIDEAELFLDCHEDFCNQLAVYLEKEAAYLKFDKINYGLINVDDMLQIENIVRGLDSELADFLINIYHNNPNSTLEYEYYNSYNFINFNYTNTLDSILNKSYNYEIENVVNIHGTVKQHMALGIDNDSQISNTQLYELNKRVIMSQFVKPQVNRANQHRADAKAISCIQSSDIIYIYGMSIGETDKRWWDLIKLTLQQNEQTQVIIHHHGLPEKNVLVPRLYNNKVYEIKNKLFSDDEINEDISNKVHIVGYNIFEPVKKINEEIEIYKHF